MQTHFDIIIIWAGAAGLFTSIESPAYLSKLILEKNKNPWVKVLLSGWERANVSNIDIEPQRDYFGQNKKALIGMFKKFNQFDTMWFFSGNGVNIVEEDRGRLILESWDSRELLELLVKKSKENNTKIECNTSVVDIMKIGEKFEILSQNWTRYTCEKLVITTGWKSFSQVWTTGDGYKWAQNFGHTIITPHRWLCGLVTKKDLSEISWVSCDVKLEVIYTSPPTPLLTGEERTLTIPSPVRRGLGWGITIYTEIWPFLFTHFWVSGPIIFNAWVAIGEYINSLNLSEFISNLDFSKIPENERQDYIERNFLKENISLKLTFDLEKTPKRIIKFLELDEENLEVVLWLQDFRTWKEAKVTGWWIKLDELTNNLESKFIPWLYFAWEILDITGKTGGFNLQFAWTSGYIVWKNLW